MKTNNFEIHQQLTQINNSYANPSLYIFIRSLSIAQPYLLSETMLQISVNIKSIIFIDMRPENQEQPETLCRKCNRYVRTANYLIHEARCKGMTSSHLSRSRNLPSRMSSSRLISEPQQEQEEKIPCHFCGYPQSLSELDTHPSQCQHRVVQCQSCHQSFPISLMSQHQFVCPERRQPFSPEMIFQRRPNMRMRRRQSSERQNPFRRSISEQRGEMMQNPLFQMMQMMADIDRMPRRQHELNLPPERSQRRRGNRGDLASLIGMLLGGMGERPGQGLQEEQIKAIPVQKYQQKGEEADLCTICYCNFQANEQTMVLPCKHLYHPECISKWLQKNHKCPVCKGSVTGRQQEPQEQPRQMGRQRIFFF